MPDLPSSEALPVGAESFAEWRDAEEVPYVVAQRIFAALDLARRELEAQREALRSLVQLCDMHSLTVHLNARRLAKKAGDHLDDLVTENVTAFRKLAAAELVVEALKAVGDANLRKLEEELRRGSWISSADRVQTLRKLLDSIQATPPTQEPRDAEKEATDA